MSSESNWRRVGWRSIRHNIIPMVVRFGAKGPKVKFIGTPVDLDTPLYDRLIAEAVEFWKGQV